MKGWPGHAHTFNTLQNANKLELHSFLMLQAKSHIQDPRLISFPTSPRTWREINTEVQTRGCQKQEVITAIYQLRRQFYGHFHPVHDALTENGRDRSYMLVY